MEIHSQVGIFLRVLAGGSHLGVIMPFGISCPTVYMSVHNVSLTVLYTFPLSVIHRTAHGMQKVSMTLSASIAPPNPIMGCMGILMRMM